MGLDNADRDVKDAAGAVRDPGEAAGTALGGRLDALYANRFPDAERAQKARLWKVLCSSFFGRYVRDTDVVVDVGAGYCDFVNNVAASRRIAVDINPDTSRHAAPGVEVKAGASRCAFTR